MWVLTSRNKDLAAFRLDDVWMDDLVSQGAFLSCGLYPMHKRMYVADPSDLRNRKDESYNIKSGPAKAAAFAILGYVDMIDTTISAFNKAPRHARRRVEKEARKVNADADMGAIIDHTRDTVAMYSKLAYWLGRSSGFEMHRVAGAINDEKFEIMRQILMHEVPSGRR